MRFLILILSFTFLFIGNSFSKECNPQKKTEFKFQRGYFYLASEPAGFDPCHSSVDFKTGSNSSQKKTFGDWCTWWRRKRRRHGSN